MQFQESALGRPATPVVNRLPITKARINLGRLAKRAHLNGEYFVLEKDGIPVIGIMDADELEDHLEIRNPKIKRQITLSNADIQAGRTRPAGELLAELRQRKTKGTVRRRRRT